MSSSRAARTCAPGHQRVRGPDTFERPNKPKVTPVCLVLPPGQLAGSGASDEFRCEPCNKILTSLTRLRRHIQNVHTRPSKEPICNICKRVYSSLNSLRNHKSIYHRQHSKNEQQRKEMEQMREREREQREHTERINSQQQPQQQHHHQDQQQQQSRLG
ncbi:Broad-complex core protein isoforms 1/2/3/4/5 [Dufourea novaeangliae]|uniref:Broad-complex core protein isoforms 1/2/3/4/5 n=1 Tax=Dufourea novaeangliae TaxID=178035 RepID=A0A154PTJ5_DUFNO|nr:Broad-complex core protein isoforms 1/2/3/4/5 [Dufourea novaeangliae]